MPHARWHIAKSNYIGTSASILPMNCRRGPVQAWIELMLQVKNNNNSNKKDCLHTHACLFNQTQLDIQFRNNSNSSNQPRKRQTETMSYIYVCWCVCVCVCMEAVLDRTDTRLPESGMLPCWPAIKGYNQY